TGTPASRSRSPCTTPPTGCAYGRSAPAGRSPPARARPRPPPAPCSPSPARARTAPSTTPNPAPPPTASCSSAGWPRPDTYTENPQGDTHDLRPGAVQAHHTTAVAGRRRGVAPVGAGAGG